MAKCRTIGPIDGEDVRRITNLMVETGLITSSILAGQNRRKLSNKIRDLSTAKKLLIEVTLALHRNENVKHADYISLYKQLIAPKLKIMNAKAIKDKLYLL
ncbi:hypothetical protein BDF20DRAFT_831620 [Mycotypha africana]|uniref:uncharacterized protein n=1 Tax=Mycotypha africana TaxID=64632 RepID=UPI0023017D8A|nr:uncharacterized protein BDF20DRAFT_831620 [Mycotypha africana]KAI8991591.1 hypothetical protein BDF20DRAFT_831620 [Mycotypha africana]